MPHSRALGACFITLKLSRRLLFCTALSRKPIFHDKELAITLYNALLTKDGFFQTTGSVTDPIERKQNQAALLALDLLRRYLQHKEI